MLTENYIHTLNNLLMEQGEQLLATQKMIGSVYYVNRTGRLLDSLGQKPTVNNLKLTIQYPLYIRFLDMKKGTGGKKKKIYEPIYNKYVYGYLYGGLYYRLKSALSGYVRRSVISTLKEGL